MEQQQRQRPQARSWLASPLRAASRAPKRHTASCRRAAAARQSATAWERETRQGQQQRKGEGQTQGQTGRTQGQQEQATPSACSRGMAQADVWAAAAVLAALLRVLDAMRPCVQWAVETGERRKRTRRERRNAAAAPDDDHEEDCDAREQRLSAVQALRLLQHPDRICRACRMPAHSRACDSARAPNAPPRECRASTGRCAPPLWMADAMSDHAGCQI